jgi:hypothetical protein
VETTGNLVAAISSAFTGNPFSVSIGTVPVERRQIRGGSGLSAAAL